MPSALARIARVVLGVAISGFFVWLLVTKLNLAQVFALVRSASTQWIAAALALLSLDYLLRGVRWWLMLRKQSPDVPLRAALSALLAGFAANNVLPLRAGDVMRAFWFNARLHSSSGFLLGTLILERALDLLTLLSIWLIVITTTHFQLPHPELIHFVWLLTIVGVLALAALLTMAAQIEALFTRILRGLFKESPLAQRLVTGIQPVFAVFKGNSLTSILSLVALSAAAWILEGTVFWMVSMALHLHLAAAAPWLAFVLANFAAMIPSAPGYIGTFHAAVITALVTLGCEQNAAASFAILVHALLWIWITLAGAVAYFLSSGKIEKAAGPVIDILPDAG
jgi:glycosyltransferase 2 family protein